MRALLRVPVEFSHLLEEQFCRARALVLLHKGLGSLLHCRPVRGSALAGGRSGNLGPGRCLMCAPQGVECGVPTGDSLASPPLSLTVDKSLGVWEPRFFIPRVEMRTVPAGVVGRRVSAVRPLDRCRRHQRGSHCAEPHFPGALPSPWVQRKEHRVWDGRVCWVQLGNVPYRAPISPGE